MKKLASELALAVERELKENGHTRTVKIEIECDCDSISIGGKVTTYYRKQMILEVVRKIVNKQIAIKDNVKVSS
jgi:hypothetical protein